MPLLKMPLIPQSCCGLSPHMRLSRYYCCVGRSTSQVKVRFKEDIREPVAAGPTTAQKHIESDPYHTACHRLQELVDNSDWDVNEAVRQEISSLPVEFRLYLFTNLGSVLILTAFLLSWLTGEDPLGGIRLNHSSLDAAVQGLGYSLPLVACSVLARWRPVKSAFPVLDDLHHSQAQIVKPVVADLNLAQVVILCTTITLPMLLLLLPALHGSVTAFGGLLDSEVLSHLGLHVPLSVSRELKVIVPAVMGGFAAAWVVASQVAVKHSQLHAIKDALDHADRWFKLRLSMDKVDKGYAASGSFSEDGSMLQQQLQPVADAKETSDAFRFVAMVWLLAKRRVAQLAYILTALNVAYFGIIWHETNDLSTPAVAALVSVLVELYYVEKSGVK